MSTQPLTFLSKLIPYISASRPGAWLFSHVLHHCDRLALKLSKGRSTLTSALSGLPVIMLTTTGAKSGLTRTVPLLGIYDPNHPNDPDYLAIIASNWGQKHYPAWYFNLKANPNATGVINGSTYSYLSREASGAEYDKFWQTASKMYIGFPRYKERASNRHIPIMILTAMPKT